MKTLKILAIASIFLFTMCKATQETQTSETTTMSKISKDTELTGGNAQRTAPIIIYKTRADYRNFVPVTLNENRSAIVSYPAPSDVYYKGKLAYPTELINGYLLDNRGITAQSAFLNITYEEYSKLENISVDFLWQNIKDATPLLELYSCGSRDTLKNGVEQLNRIIEGGFKGCNKIKVPPTATLNLPGKE